MVSSIAGKIGCTEQTLSNWVGQRERPTSEREETSTGDVQRVQGTGARAPSASSCQHFTRWLTSVTWISTRSGVTGANGF